LQQLVGVAGDVTTKAAMKPKTGKMANRRVTTVEMEQSTKALYHLPDQMRPVQRSDRLLDVRQQFFLMQVQIRCG
jgi:hypothetical protein